MKQKDVVLIIVILFISGVMSFLISNVLFSSPEGRSAEVEVVEAITTEFNKPDDRFFNANSINPTQLIQIGDQDNLQPF